MTVTPPPQPPPGMSNTARFWIGVPVGALGVPALAVGILVVAGVVSGSSSGVATALVWVLGILVLAAVVAGLVWRATRWFVLGAVAGGAVVTIVLAGVCVAILQSLGP